MTNRPTRRQRPVPPPLPTPPAVLTWDQYRAFWRVLLRERGGNVEEALYAIYLYEHGREADFDQYMGETAWMLTRFARFYQGDE